MKKKVLITDVDNTLFDWQLVWHKTFTAMIERVVEISKVDREVIYKQCSDVHQKYGTSEYSGLLSELPCLKDLYGSQVGRVMKPAIDAFREVRTRELKLYPTVESTLKTLRNENVLIVAFTESKAFYTTYRFLKLRLDDLFDILYSPADHSVPNGTIESRLYPPDNYKLKHAEHRFTPEGEVKPNPDILLQIIKDLCATPDEVVYVGDSILKDVAMAQAAKVTDVHAAYGVAQGREEYELLRKVTHWTPEMVERERISLRPGALEASFILKETFSEILPIFCEVI